MRNGETLKNMKLSIASLFNKFFFTLKCISGLDHCRLQRKYWQELSIIYTAALS